MTNVMSERRTQAKTLSREEKLKKPRASTESGETGESELCCLKENVIGENAAFSK